MKVHEVTGDRQAEAQPAGTLRGRQAFVPEAIEDPRQEIRGDPFPGIRDDDFDHTVRRANYDTDESTLRSELDRIGEKVGDHLLQPHDVAAHETADRVARADQ